jgi:hypothetical protein
MDQFKVQSELLKWLEKFVEAPNPSLGNWAPCPYARKARINNQIKIEFIESVCRYRDSYEEILKDYEVVIYCFDHTKISGQDLAEWVRHENNIIIPNNYVILEDHPDTNEEINGVSMNFGHCGLLVVQELNRLNTASEQLKSKGYYDTWTKENLEDVVNWRFKNGT